jgi:hypothetical protein
VWQLLALAPFSILVVTLCGLINSLLYVLVVTLFIAVPHASTLPPPPPPPPPRHQPPLPPCPRILLAAPFRAHPLDLVSLIRPPAPLPRPLFAGFHEVVELDALDALELEGLQSAIPSAV